METEKESRESVEFERADLLSLFFQYERPQQLCTNQSVGYGNLEV